MPNTQTAETQNKTSIESLRHKDKPKDVRTEELRNFVAADENAPKKMLYPRAVELGALLPSIPDKAFKGEL